MSSQVQPAVQPQQTVSFVQPIASRDGTLVKDSRMMNAFVEQTPNGMALVKRPGTSEVFSGATGTAQGSFNCGTRSYCIINDTIYDVLRGNSVPIPGVTVSGQQYYCLSDVPSGVSYLKSASGLWQLTGTSAGTSTFVKVTDPNYPTTTVAGIVYLDGIYYVMDETGTIWGSETENGGVWPALDFIQADLSFGAGAGIYRHLNFIIAYYAQGIQFYYDANAAPNGEGTALGPVSNCAWTTGLASGDSVVEMTDLSFFLAQDAKHGRTLQMINGEQITVVSTPFVEKAFNRAGLAQGTVKAWGLRTVGHSFYGITFTDLNLTFVYDIAANQWYQWSSYSGGVDNYFVGVNYLNGQGMDLMQDATSGVIFQVNPSAYADYNAVLRVIAVTSLYDYGTPNWKRVADHIFLADNINTNISVSYSQDDYTTWSTPATVSLAQDRKQLRNCGRFRRRAYMMLHSDTTPLRLMDSKLDLTVLNS